MAEGLTLVMSMVSEQAFANLKDCPSVILESWPRIMDVLPLLLNRLIRYYQQQLVRHGADAPTIDELQYAYRLCAVYCLVYPIIAASSAHASDSLDALLIADRALSAVLDNGALELAL